MNDARAQVGKGLNHVAATDKSMSICVCVRKRPLFEKEHAQGELDSCSASNPLVVVHEPKLKVDGISKYI